MKDIRRCRAICQIRLQEFWFGDATMADVLDAYGVERGDDCHGRVVKYLLKTKKDFINGFSFFTRESVDEKMREMCMKG